MSETMSPEMVAALQQQAGAGWRWVPSSKGLVKIPLQGLHKWGAPLNHPFSYVGFSMKQTIQLLGYISRSDLGNRWFLSRSCWFYTHVPAIICDEDYIQLQSICIYIYSIIIYIFAINIYIDYNILLYYIILSYIILYDIILYDIILYYSIFY